jgi:hypothetical protein
MAEDNLVAALSSMMPGGRNNFLFEKKSFV